MAEFGLGGNVAMYLFIDCDYVNVLDITYLFHILEISVYQMQKHVIDNRNKK